MYAYQKPEGLVLNVKVTPNAPKTEIVGESGDFLKVKIKAVPEKGKANQELIELLSEKYGIPKSNIEILRGQASSRKVILLRDFRLEK